MRSLTIIATLLLSIFIARGVDPTDTSYSFQQCEGSAMPYPVPAESVTLPDSLTAVFINHVGRHGARFPSSPKNVTTLIRELAKADSAKALTPAGEELLTLAKFVSETSRNRWGALDSLGMAEQRGIASRMFRNYGMLFNDTRINAISSYSPRCVMSMYEFTHQLDRLNNHIEITTSSGRQNSPLMRPFDLDSDFIEWAKNGDWKAAYEMQFETMMPTAPARKLFKGEYAKEMTNDDARKVSYHAFKLLQGLSAMGLPSKMERYFTREEANQAWSCTNLSHYLERTASTLSTLPAEIAAPLLTDLLTTAEAAVEGKQQYAVMLRFGHAETLMPLLSLMHLDGCYYLTNYFDTVALHWKDFHVVPMASNLQMILVKSKSGKMYVRLDLNERPIPLLPGSDIIYTPWEQAREYLLRCIPLHLRP
jgi:hypothetical protein